MSDSSLVRLAIALLGFVAVGCGDASRPTEEALGSVQESLISKLTVQLTRIYIGRNAGTGFYSGGVSFTGFPGPILPLWECPSPTQPPVPPAYGDWVPPALGGGSITFYCDPPDSSGLARIGDITNGPHTTYTLTSIAPGTTDIPVTVSLRDMALAGNPSHDFDWHFTVNANTGAVTAADPQGNVHAATGGLSNEHSCARGPDDWMICWQIDVPGACVPTPDDNCDGLDNDCDNVVDDDFPTTATCGVGACMATGTQTCINRVISTSCVPKPQPALVDVFCDGVDEDCNGVVDDRADPIPIKCGLGVCTADGMSICESGRMVDHCDPLDAASPEVFDRLDNDCDGLVNECNPGQSDWWCCAQNGQSTLEFDVSPAIADVEPVAQCAPLSVAPGTQCSVRGVFQAAEQSGDNGCSVVARLAPGTYPINTSLRFDRGNLSLIGQGTSATATKLEAVNDPPNTDHVVIYAVGAPPPAVAPSLSLSRLTVRKGTSPGGTAGGGVFMDNGSVLVDQSVIEENSASTYGAGLTILNGNGIVRDSVIRHNSLRNVNTLIGGFTSRGGGIYVSYGTLKVEKSAVVGNGAAKGGGIDVSYSEVTLTNSTVSNNQCGESGCGVRIEGDSPALLRFNTIAQNHLLQADAINGDPIVAGPGLFADNATKLELHGNIIAMNAYFEGFSHGNGNNGTAEDCHVTLRNATDALPVRSSNLIGQGGDDCATLGTPIADPLIGTAAAPKDANLPELAGKEIAAPPLPPVVAEVCTTQVTPACIQYCRNLTAAECLMPLPSFSPAVSAFPTGATGDAPAACPLADQRYYIRPIGGRCTLGAVDYAGQSDADHDGIPDSLDPQPTIASFVFSDGSLFGVTSGTITTRGDQSLTFEDAPGLEAGVVVLAAVGGGAAPAQISACGGSLPITLAAGQSRVITCPRPHACVYGSQTLTIRDRAKVMTDPSGGAFTISAEAAVFGDILSHAGGSIGDRAHIYGNARLAGVLTGNRAAVHGTLLEHATVSAESITSRSGTSSVTAALNIAANSSTVLEPGDYGVVTIGTLAQVHLANAGLYRFKSLTVAPDVGFWVEDPEHQTVLAVDGALALGDRFILRGVSDPNLFLLYTNGSTASIGHDARLVGGFESPSAALEIRDRVHFRGCASGRLATIGIDSVVGDEAAVCNPDNLIVNAGFESGVSGWTTPGGTLAATTARARSGTQSGRVTSRTATTHGPNQSLLGKTTAGVTYQARAFASPSTSSNQTLKLVARYRCGTSPEQTQLISQKSGGSAAWTDLSGTFTAPSCAVSSYKLAVEGPASGVTLYVDDVSVLQKCL